MNGRLRRAVRAALGRDQRPVVEQATMEGALARLKHRSTRVAAVVDVGASDGRWSAQALPYFPAAAFLLVEAQTLHRQALEEFQRRHPNARFALVVAGNREGTIFFDASDPFGGVAGEQPPAEAAIQLPVTTVDALVTRNRLTGPFLLKLDTHGFELPILDGAKSTLADTSVLIIECYNFRLTPETLRFPEMCSYLQERGFRCVDLVDPMIRARDGAFWQADFVFIREDDPLFDVNLFD